MYGLEVQKVNLKDRTEREEVDSFLKSMDLILDYDVDYTLVIRENGKIKATCSKAKNVLKCFAVSKEWRGEGVTSTLISSLIDKLFEQGIYHSFIFTKPENIDTFQGCGFKLVHKVREAALLENGIYDINGYLDKLKKEYNINDEEKSALVMNCNPFTEGHKYLIEKAAAESKEVLVFIVEEDKSLFPFNIRFNLVKEGTKHLKNVKVIPGGDYIISSATFPAYFLREESSRLRSYTELDAGIFGEYFSKRLHITRRYVGEEPYCRVTSVYNRTLMEVLTRYGVDLYTIERMTSEGEAISASSVRNYIKQDEIEKLRKIIPMATWEFLNTNLGKEIMEKIKNSNSPH